MKLGYIIPEFPGQTHVWMWREITYMRESGVECTIFSTRPPPARDRARHAFAESAEKATVYLWPRALSDWIGATASAVLTKPIRFSRCFSMAMRLPIEEKPAWKTLLPLLAPASVLAREVTQRRIDHMHCHSCASSAVLAMLAKRLTG